MGTNFHRVRKSLERDGSLKTNLYLLTAILLPMLWVMWAFRAKVTRYEVSDSAHVEIDRVRSHNLEVITEFEPYAAFTQLRTGQAAILRLKTLSGAQYQTVPAHVSRIAQEIQGGKVRVGLALDSTAALRVFLHPGLSGSVSVDVEHISPAVMILRSVGALAGAN